MKTTVSNLTLLFTLLFSFQGFSQEFVTKETGDTLFGEVKVKESGGYKISVKPSGAEDFTEFEGKEIKAYQIGEKGLFQKEENTSYGFFIKKEIVGDGAPYLLFLQPVDDNDANAINLYLELRSITFVKDNNMMRNPATLKVGEGELAVKITQKKPITKPKTYGFENGQISTTNTDVVYYMQKGGGTVRVNQFEYKTTLSNLLSDCPDLAGKIGKKGYKYDDMQAITKEYNETCGKK